MEHHIGQSPSRAQGMNRTMRGILAGLVSLFAATEASSARRVSLPPAGEIKTVEIVLTGAERREFVVDARAGQIMAVALVADGEARFRILPPGSTTQSLPGGAVESAMEVAASGDHVVRVYLTGRDRARGYRVPVIVSLSLM